MSYPKHHDRSTPPTGLPVGAAATRDASSCTGQQLDKESAIVRIDRRQLRASLASFDKIDEFLSSIDVDVQSTGESGCSHVCSNTRLIRELRAAEHAAKNHAQQGVDKITIRTSQRGRMRVSVGSFPEIVLGRSVADTLHALATGTGSHGAGDGLVPWKTYEELGWLIKQRTGRAPRVHALSNHIYRLRRAMANGGNPFLVQTDAKRRSARFALSSTGRIIDGDA